MDNPAKAFEDALSEEGVTANVTHQVNGATQTDEFRVRKTINGEPFTYTYTTSEHVSLDKTIAQHARIVARQFEQHLTKKVEWGDGCSAKFDFKSEPSILCLRCGAKATFDDLKRTGMVRAEAAVPQPPIMDLSNLPRIKQEFALLATLRDKCEDYCPNHHRKV